MYMTVGDLKKALENVDDSCEIRYQRIEDVYFDKNGTKFLCDIHWNDTSK